jgi:hypothetical protein
VSRNTYIVSTFFEKEVEARKAGTSFVDLHRRAYAGEFQPDSPLDLRVPLGDPRAPL